MCFAMVYLRYMQLYGLIGVVRVRVCVRAFVCMWVCACAYVDMWVHACIHVCMRTPVRTPVRARVQPSQFASAIGNCRRDFRLHSYYVGKKIAEAFF